MKKLNKNCLKQKYWNYCFKCNQEKLILKNYSLSFENKVDN